VQFNKRSLATLPIAIVQTAIGWATIAICVGLVILFALQFPHSAKLDTVWLVTHLHLYGDPLLGEIAPYLNSKWPLNGLSFVPLAVALGAWVVKLILNLGFMRVRRLVAKLIPVEKGKGARTVGGLMEETEIAGAETAEAREHLLKRYREIEGKLKAAKRKRCSFLSIDVVGSTQMKVGERETEISATFQAYEEMLKKIFKQYGAWKDAWTPDGVMVCFLQSDLAVAAAIRILQRLKKFNEHDNKLRTPFRIRCGVNEGEVQIFEDSKLEKVADRVIDVAGHMQKEGRANTLWLGEEVYNLLADKSDFRETDKVVDGFKVYEWSLDAPPPEVKPAPVKPAMRTAPAPPPIVAATADMEATQDGVLRRIGRYEILNELGRGAMGAVYQARDPQIGRIVAIKVIMVGNQPAEVLEDYKQRFYREAQTAGQMSHPGIVTIYDMAESADGNPYLVMEFVEGTTLDKLLAPQKPGEISAEPPMPLKQRLDIAAQVADALDYAHRRKVIHRDIKPANILVTPEGKAKIADFGIAKMAGTQMTHTGLLVGTPAFMSPEQITGGEIDSRSDIFSFGVLAYWMLTGKRPFPGDAITQIAYKVVHAPPVPIRELNPDLPADIEPVIFKCLGKKPQDRYSTAKDLAADLEALKARATLASANQPTPSAG
jgi:class 3 adenylate cyclase